MKRSLFLITVLLIGLFAACSNNEEPPPAPTQEVSTPDSGAGEGQQQPPTEGGALARIQNSGTLVAGTSADYPPFAFYNNNFALDGFEIALIRDIGAEMGVDVQIRDIAFDGLADSLQLGQIDVAIAAISVTPDREAVADFSNVYYVGEDGILATAGAQIGPFREADDMKGLRIGVQNQTVYQDWAQENLVDTGLIAQKDLHVYGQIEQAIADLDVGRTDLVMLDLKPAEVAVASGGVELAGQGLNKQRFAIALTQGETGLQTILNEALIRLQNQGRLAVLAREYLDLDDIPPIEILPPVDPGQPPAGCLDGSAYVADLSLDDQNMSTPAQMLPGQTFRKGWRLQNIGTCTWDSNYALAYVGGNSAAAQMGGMPVQVQGQVQPGQTYDFWVDLVAPTVPGTYQGFWAMQNGGGETFGARVWVGITVISVQPTPVPTVPPSANVTFTVDRTSIKQGECVTFSWNVTNIQAVWFYPNSADYTQYPTTGQSSSTQCPAETATYNLRILDTDGTVETRQITITVDPSNEAPRVVRFQASPSQVKLGQCLTLSWFVEGNATHVRITRGGFVLWDGAPLSGSLQDCPPESGFAVYRIEAGGPGGTSSLQTNVSVFE